MPFTNKGSSLLTARLEVRLSPDEKRELHDVASSAGLPVAELVRLRALGKPVVPRSDATTIRELRRIGGLLKKVHTDSGGAYSKQTAAVLTSLGDAVAALVSGGEKAP